MISDALEAVDYRAMFQILEELDRLDTAERFSATVVEQLAEHFGWRSLIFQLSPSDLGDFREGRVGLRRVRFAHNLGRDLVEEMVERWGDWHPLGPSVARGLDNGRNVVAISDMPISRDRELHDYVETFMRSRKIKDVLHSAVDGGARGALALCVYASGDAVTDRQRAVIDKLSRMLVPMFKQHPTPAPQCEATGMTERETLVARLAAEGYANREIALRLNVSLGTVKKHLSQAMAKNGCTSRTQLALRLRVA